VAHPEVPDDQVGDDEPNYTRGDLRDIERALRQDWPIPPRVKNRILQHAINLTEPGDDGKAKPRTQLAAMKIVALFMRLNLDQQRLDLIREKLRGRDADDQLDETIDQAAAEAACRAAQAAINGQDSGSSSGDPQLPPDQ
jgi:hypothetical protein